MKRFLLLLLLFLPANAYAEGFIELRIPCNTGEQVTAEICITPLALLSGGESASPYVKGNLAEASYTHQAEYNPSALLLDGESANPYVKRDLAETAYTNTAKDTLPASPLGGVSVPSAPHIARDSEAKEVIQLGQVLTVPTATNYPAYTASKWASPSTVCASAVNAIHILISTENGRGRIISLIPAVTFAPAAGDVSYFALDMPAGTGIFGAFAPLTGSKVTILHDGKESHITDTPNEGDTLIIRTALPENPSIYMADIENRPGGRVIAYSRDGAKVIARVVRPVKGVGRFGGTEFQGRGRIRASHSGVIDIVTSPRGQAGGIQIIPLKHALTSHEMLYSWGASQWMIIAPLPNAPDLEGQPPLYKHSFMPGAQMNDSLPGKLNTYTRRPLILCRRNGGDWENLPKVSGKIDDAFYNVTHIRLYFPYME